MSLTMLVATATVGMIDAPLGVESVGVVPPTLIVHGLIIAALVLIARQIVSLHDSEAIDDNGGES